MSFKPNFGCSLDNTLYHAFCLDERQHNCKKVTCKLNSDTGIFVDWDARLKFGRGRGSGGCLEVKFICLHSEFYLNFQLTFS